MEMQLTDSISVQTVQFCIAFPLTVCDVRPVTAEYTLTVNGPIFIDSPRARVKVRAARATGSIPLSHTLWLTCLHYV